MWGYHSGVAEVSSHLGCDSLGECYPDVFGARWCFVCDAQAVQEEQLFCLDYLALKIEALQSYEASGNHLPNDTQDLNTLLWLRRFEATSEYFYPFMNSLQEMDKMNM